MESRHTSAPSARLVALSVVLGLAGGAAAWVLQHLIGLITSVVLFGRLGFDPPPFTELHPSPRIVVAAVLGAFVVTCMAKWAPVIRGHGIPEAMEAILVRESRIAPRTAVAKPLSSAVAIGTAAPFGAEGPIIVTGGAIGSLLGQVLDVSPSERKILLACGAAAGMAAIFGAPIASVVLAIELLLFELSARSLVPLVIAASVGAGVHVAISGPGALFTVPDHAAAGLATLPAFVILGALCGVLAVVITRGLFVIEEGYRRLPFSQFWHPVIGAVAFATIGLLAPRALGVGYDAIDDVLNARLALGTVAVLGLVKLVIWWLALGSGTSGGTLAPILLISASVGTLIGTALSNLGIGAGVAATTFALVAMAATFGAATRATLTAIVFVFELSHDYRAILPLMLATVVADLVFSALSDDSIMTEKLTRRGLRLGRHYRVDPLETTPVGLIMTSPPVTIDPSLPLSLAREWMLSHHHSAYPVTGADGSLVGVVSRRDLLEPDLGTGGTLAEVMSSDLVTIAPDESALAALHRMIDESVDHLPVVIDGAVVGMCTRTDVLRVRHDQRHADVRQPGLARRYRGDVSVDD